LEARITGTLTEPSNWFVLSYAFNSQITFVAPKLNAKPLVGTVKLNLIDEARGWVTLFDKHLTPIQLWVPAQLSGSVFKLPSIPTKVTESKVRDEKGVLERWFSKSMSVVPLPILGAFEPDSPEMVSAIEKLLVKNISEKSKTAFFKEIGKFFGI
jgi:hypothetical protein